MGADLRRDEMEVAAWRFSDATAFRFVEYVLQSVRMWTARAKAEHVTIVKTSFIRGENVELWGLLEFCTP